MPPLCKVARYHVVALHPSGSGPHVSVVVIAFSLNQAYTASMLCFDCDDLLPHINLNWCGLCDKAAL